jgi:hypothetical protein
MVKNRELNNRVFRSVLNKRKNTIGKRISLLQTQITALDIVMVSMQNDQDDDTEICDTDSDSDLDDDEMVIEFYDTDSDTDSDSDHENKWWGGLYVE